MCSECERTNSAVARCKNPGEFRRTNIPEANRSRIIYGRKQLPVTVEGDLVNARVWSDESMNKVARADIPYDNRRCRASRDQHVAGGVESQVISATFRVKELKRLKGVRVPDSNCPGHGIC
jgi:hypothetical protein